MLNTSSHRLAATATPPRVVDVTEETLHDESFAAADELCQLRADLAFLHADAVSGRKLATSDHELWDRMLHAAEHGAAELDFTGYAYALRRLPTGAMATLGRICSLQEPLTTHLILPRLHARPDWLDAFGMARHVTLQDVCVHKFDLKGLPHLAEVSVRNVKGTRTVTFDVPNGCKLKATGSDGRPLTIVASRMPGQWRVFPRGFVMNGTASFADAAQAPGDPPTRTGDDGRIVCCQLSLAIHVTWAEESLHIQAGMSPMPELGMLDAPEAIGRACAREFDRLHSELQKRPRESYLVSFSKWDEFLQSRIGYRPSADAVPCHMVLQTENHVMAARLRPSKAGTWVLDWRDPNADATAMSHPPFRFEFDFPLPRALPLYFPPHEGLGSACAIHVIILDDPLAPETSVARKSQPIIFSTEFIEARDLAHPGAALEICRVNEPEPLSALAKAFRSADFTPDQCAAFLGGKIGNAPLIHLMLSKGWHRSLLVFGNMLLHAFERGLEPDRIAEILRCARAIRGPGLAAALEEGHAECVINFGKVLATLYSAGALTQAHVLSLIRARKGDTPGDRLAKKKDVARAYLDAVKLLRHEGAIPPAHADDLVDDAKAALARTRKDAKLAKKAAKVRD